MFISKEKLWGGPFGTILHTFSSFDEIISIKERDRTMILHKDLCLIEKEIFTTFRKIVVTEITKILIPYYWILKNAHSLNIKT